jgi:hypothetical protein
VEERTSGDIGRDTASTKAHFATAAPSFRGGVHAEGERMFPAVAAVQALLNGHPRRPRVRQTSKR